MTTYNRMLSSGKNKRDNTSAIIVCVFVYIMTFIIISWSIKSFLDTPTVYKSSISKICIRVDDPRFTCDILPEKYHIVWSK